MNSIVQLLKYFGAFTAIVVSIGFASKSDYALFEKHDVTTVEEMSLYSGDEESSTLANGRVAEYRTPDRLVRNRPSAPASRDRSISRRVGESTPSVRASESSRPRASSKSFSARELEDWIQMNVAQTYLESEKETMSPGVILATGVYFLQQGKGDMGMNAADVAGYLAEVRKSASAEAKAKMKYIANSDQWFAGLKLAGFDGDKIASIFNNHQLAAYDKQMYTRHIERKIEQQNYTVEDEALAADKEKRRSNLADAYNDYADRDEVREKYSLPTLVTSKPMSTKEVSEGRLEAESFRAGQSKKYDNPRFFWSVLKEMIALEHDYDSWDEYSAKHKRAADKEFESRSNIMAMGGVMKVTRKGA